MAEVWKLCQEGGKLADLGSQTEGQNEEGANPQRERELHWTAGTAANEPPLPKWGSEERCAVGWGH